MPIKLPSFRPRRDAYPPDLWTKCPSCAEMLFNRQLDKARRVCPRCGHHFRLSAAARLELMLDPGTFTELDAGLQSVDPLGFVDQKPYPDRILAAQTATGLRDAAVRGLGAIEGRQVSICVMDFGFMGGSMGAVVGEKVTRAAEEALARRVPLVVVSASGGARMQEGTLALMQLAKTVGALERLKGAGIPYLSILTDPTTGGVFASYAVLGDINLAEPNALIGFAGARVSAGTIGAELPPGFQRSEFLFEHGFVDRVVHRSDLRGEVALLLRYLQPHPDGAGVGGNGVAGSPAFRPLELLSSLADRVLIGADEAGADAPTRTASTARSGPTRDEGAGRRGDPGRRGAGGQAPDGASGTEGDRVSADAESAVWSQVQLARNLRRPHALELIGLLADGWVELHGDRLFGEDGAIVAGLATIGRHRVALAGMQKGGDTDENIRRNFGMPHPEGYRKAMRIMDLAGRFGLPVITLIDVPGAHPGAESEERGIADAIARSIGLMSRLRVPVVAAITGEGGSGGALALAVADVVIALENAVYSVITPEGCASILWRTPDEAPAAARAMRMSAMEQRDLGVVDIVVPEPPGGAHADHAETARRLRATIVEWLDALAAVPPDQLVAVRYRRFRSLGSYTETAAAGPPPVRSGLADRLRNLFDPNRWATPLPGSLPAPGRVRDEPPARGEV